MPAPARGVRRCGRMGRSRTISEANWKEQTAPPGLKSTNPPPLPCQGRSSAPAAPDDVWRDRRSRCRFQFILACYGSSLVDRECGKDEPPLFSAGTCWIVRSSSQYYKVIPTTPERIAAKNGRSTGNRGTVKLRVGSRPSATDDCRIKSMESRHEERITSPDK
jgi:hypothetical protein